MTHKFEVQVQEFEVQDVVDAYQAFEEFDRVAKEINLRHDSSDVDLVEIFDGMDSGIIPTAKDFENATHVMGQIMEQAHRKGVNFTFKPEEV